MALFADMPTAFMEFLMNPTPRHWYLPVIAAAVGASFAVRELRTATTGGLHHLSWLLLGIAVLFLAVTLADRSLRRIGKPATA